MGTTEVRNDGNLDIPDIPVVNPLEWRERYHWRHLRNASGRGQGPVAGDNITLSTPSPAVWSPIPQGLAAFAPDSFSLLPLLYSQLVVMAADDEIGAHRNAIEGDLTLSWETPEDTALIFQLRPDVFWPEAPLMERRRLVTSDVQAMHETYRSLETPQGQAYRAVAGIEVEDDAGTI